MTNFTLSAFEHFRSNPLVNFKTEIVGGEEVTIVSYMMADKDFWDLPLAEETRGITFDKNGNCICLPLHKMFNINERPNTQMSALDFTDAQFFTKRDGSMVTPVLLNGNIYWKTKKSFHSDVAKRATTVADQNLISFSRCMLELGVTPIFEFTDPDHRIVVDYGMKPKFTLLAMRWLALGTYLPYEICVALAGRFDVEVIDRHECDPMQLLETLKHAVCMEGFIIHHRDGMKTKVKCPWYVTNHRIMTELRERDVALAVVDEAIDDMKAVLVEQGKDLAVIQPIEDSVIYQLESIVLEVQQLCEQFKLLPSKKDIALTHGKHPLFKLAVELHEGKDPDYKKYWKKHYLRVDYSLRIVYNESFTSKQHV